MKKVKIKRGLSVIMVVVMLALSITACGPSKSSENISETTAQKSATTVEATKDTAPEQVEITFLQCWNGHGGAMPDDQVNNPVAKRIREKTGVTLKMESITTDELEKLNIMFASGTVPDLVNAPAWTTFEGTGGVIKKAALEGQILELDPYIEKYPNVKKLLEVGIAKDFYEFDLHNAEFKGKTYLIPQQTPDGTPESINNWLAGCYARGDILKALNVKAEDIDTSDELYDLLEKIKNGGFKDINGKPVIAAGTRHNGWDSSQFVSFWSDYNISDFRLENGKLINFVDSKNEENKIMFMRKLIKNGLFDLEAFSNTDTMAKEKLSTGKLAVFGDHSGVDILVNTLYKTNPEMKYELLGPFKNLSGKIATQVEKKGRSGFPAMFLSSKTKNADAVLRFIDYVNSEEGQLLSFYGIEGTHYTMNDGRPVKIPEMLEKYKADPNLGKNEGLAYLNGFFIGAFSSSVKWPQTEAEKDEITKTAETYKPRLPVAIVDKISANYLALDWPKLKEYNESIAQINYTSEVQKAYYAKTDEIALKILKDVREKYKNAGAQEKADFVFEKAASRDDVAY